MQELDHAFVFKSEHARVFARFATAESNRPLVGR